MKWLDAEAVALFAPHGEVVETLREGFRSAVQTPIRHHHETGAATLLMMPAWSKDWTGLKTVTVKPDNVAQGIPSIQGTYLLIDNRTGAPVALMDGGEITRRRTAAASALAADYLARKDASVLALFGAGALATHFVRAHAAVRPIKSVRIVNRSKDKAEAVAREIRAMGFDATLGTAEEAAREADILTCATNATSPLFKGAWLKPGAHVDLVGAYKPLMREADGETVAKASVYVDTFEGARTEAGDLIQAESEGVWSFDRVKGDLAQLCKGEVKGRTSAGEITLFKSCGTALEDLVTAIMVHLRSA